MYTLIEKEGALILRVNKEEVELLYSDEQERKRQLYTMRGICYGYALATKFDNDYIKMLVKLTKMINKGSA